MGIHVDCHRDTELHRIFHRKDVEIVPKMNLDFSGYTLIATETQNCTEFFTEGI
jgi:hypothetical protein